MKITDETKTFAGEDGTLEVSSNFSDTHEFPSMYLYADDGAGNSQGFGTSDTDQIKEIIQHMAKMAGLEVEITERSESVDFTPKFQKGDRVRSLIEEEYGLVGTVMHDMKNPFGWHVRVMLDGHTYPGLYEHDELELVTKSV